ncbi:60S ribosomal protein L23, partial [Trifolium medium]|nr:60S ribosomal protein L23 [Trifolium medium]
MTGYKCEDGQTKTDMTQTIMCICLGPNHSKGYMKCNVDAACYAAENKYSIGACLRDDHGNFVKAISTHFIGQPSVHEAEAQGLLITLKWLQQMQITRIEIEMDCLQVVQNIARKMKNLT